LNHSKHRLDARSSNPANLQAIDPEATMMFSHVSIIAIIALSANGIYIEVTNIELLLSHLAPT
jgi:hypothetical protein